jgi:aspartate beta-hydroxylase
MTNGGTDRQSIPMQETDCEAAAERPLPIRFQKYIGQLRLPDARRRLRHYPDLIARPWHQPQEFALVRDLERNAPRIVAEAGGIKGQDYTDEIEKIGRSGRWTVFPLYERGARNERNCKVCPAATKIVEAHPNVAIMAGKVYFSCLDPHTRVAAHKGPTNMRVRCHFGIDTPVDCGIRVGTVTKRWTPGRCIVFEDSFEHEVWNLSGCRRVVLVVDLWHPDLSEDEIRLIDGLLRYAFGGKSTSEPNVDRENTE